MSNPPRKRLPRQTTSKVPLRYRVSPWMVWLVGIPFVMVPLLGALYFLGHNPIEPLLQAFEEEEMLELQIESLQEENDELQRDVDALGPGQFGIEKRARERLGWSMPGEVVIHVPDKK